MENQTSQPEFILLGLSDLTEFWIPLFLLILFSFMATLVGNFLIIFLVATDSHLQTPMYIFLSNFSAVDIFTPCVSASHLLFDIFTGNTVILYTTCIAQVYFFTWFVSTEIFLLGIMSYDRYVAICHPLHYTTIISIHLCVQLMAGLWVFSSAYSLMHTLCTLRLVFCGPTTIPGLLCELYQFIQLSCSDTSLSYFLLSILAVSFAVFVLFITFLSYVYIFKTILQIKMKNGRSKAYSTCSSHLTVVLIYYVTTFFNYVQPKTRNLFVSRLVSVVYIFFTPFLNPLIYSLRNSELQGALYRALVSVSFKS